MEHSSLDGGGLPPQARAGIAFGMGLAAVIMSGFGFLWWGWGLGALPAFPPAGWIVLYLAAIIFVIASVRALLRGKALIKKLNADSGAYWKTRRKSFRIVTIGEAVGCGIVLGLTNHFQRPDLVASGIAFVVGLHFLPLAPLFEFPAYYAVGAALALCAVLSAVLLHGDASTAMAGISAGAILWITALLALYRSRRFAKDPA